MDTGSDSKKGGGRDKASKDTKKGVEVPEESTQPESTDLKSPLLEAKKTGDQWYLPGNSSLTYLGLACKTTHTHTHTCTHTHTHAHTHTHTHTHTQTTTSVRLGSTLSCPPSSTNSQHSPSHLQGCSISPFITTPSPPPTQCCVSLWSWWRGGTLLLGLQPVRPQPLRNRRIPHSVIVSMVINSLYVHITTVEIDVKLIM